MKNNYILYLYDRDMSLLCTKGFHCFMDGAAQIKTRNIIIAEELCYYYELYFIDNTDEIEVYNLIENGTVK